MNSTVRTIYGIDLALSNLKGTIYNPLPNTTLNEKFNLKIKRPREVIDNPIIKGFCIGNGNKNIIDSTNDDVNLFYGRYNPTDASLHSHIPFIVRELRFDLGDNEKKQYRLRKEFVIGDMKYVAYYMKVINTLDQKSQLLKINVKPDGSYGVSNFNTSDASILNPSETSTEDIATSTNNEYVVISDQITLVLTKDELEEINKGMIIMGLDKVNPKINELAICTGFDAYDDLSEMMESYSTQIFVFIDLPYEVDLEINDENGFYREVEIGGMEPIALR